MSNGKLSWRNKIEIRYEDDQITVEFASLFKVHDQIIDYVLGNAHLFRIPTTAYNISVEETVKLIGSANEMVGVYLLDESMSSSNIFQSQDVLRVFPETKFLQDLEDFSLVLRYSVPWTRPLREKFQAHVDVGFFVRDYLASLGCGDSEILGSIEILIYPPVGCDWDVNEPIKDEISKGITKLRCMELNGDTGLHIARQSIDVSLRPNGLAISAAQAGTPLRLPIYQDAVALRQYSDKINKEISDIPGETVVVFVCDLRGSTVQTRDGKPSADILRYHGFWRRDTAEPFRLLKIVGDLVLAVCEPRMFLRKGLLEILSAHDKSVQLGLPIRGGFHTGIAKAAGSLSENMSGSAIGMDFLGDAINHGSKIGDFKDNDNGLIASKAFVDWLKSETGVDPGAAYWREMQIGALNVELFRVEPGQLLKTVRGAMQESSGATFPDKLVGRAKKIKSRLIIGLDPDISRFPAFLRETWRKHPSHGTLQDLIFLFNQTIIEATHEFAVAFKPQIAFYEQYGEPGIRALARTIRFLREKEQIVILDAKRNDIEHTAKAYADAWLAEYRPFTGEVNDWRVDAITLNAYLGIEGVTPFLQVNNAAGTFLLAKTSNPSSADLQDLKLEKGATVYEEMARLADAWGRTEPLGSSRYSRVGLVVGATHPDACEKIRNIATAALFLMPGVGAQGAPLKSIKSAGGRDGFGAYASSSRSVLYSFVPDKTKGENWREIVRESAASEAKKLRDAINEEFIITG
jgi:orotidine-5'-phosphate decarboxylase